MQRFIEPNPHSGCIEVKPSAHGPKIKQIKTVASRLIIIFRHEVVAMLAWRQKKVITFRLGQGKAIRLRFEHAEKKADNIDTQYIGCRPEKPRSCLLPDLALRQSGTQAVSIWHRRLLLAHRTTLYRGRANHTLFARSINRVVGMFRVWFDMLRISRVARGCGLLVALARYKRQIGTGQTGLDHGVLTTLII
jgi:hypothetical protein